jgi:hypothetical protein
MQLNPMPPAGQRQRQQPAHQAGAEDDQVLV